MHCAGCVVRLRFWGVRGSIPVPGIDTSRYGGNTSCVELVAPGQAPVVFDCGTGSRLLGRELLRRPERQLNLVFSHFHMDHLLGFPFFAPVFAPSFAIDVLAPTFSPEQTRDRIGRYLNGVFHPVRVNEIMARLSFDHIRPAQSVERGDFRLSAVQLNHPGGAYGYVVEHQRRRVAYLTDTAPLSRPGEGLAGGGRPNVREERLVRAIEAADTVVFDTMFSEAEYLEKMTWGHSYPEYGVAVARAAKVRRLVLFHHSPDASDDELDQLAQRWAKQTDLEVVVAREGMELEVA